ncbi:MAG TPA: hypothetical protein VLJ79_16055 [Candidatus Binatia bacterium]|nr:hypothetical protein [Candidatus Binatia bacterium]
MASVGEGEITFVIAKELKMDPAYAEEMRVPIEQVRVVIGDTTSCRRIAWGRPASS